MAVACVLIGCAQRPPGGGGGLLRTVPFSLRLLQPWDRPTLRWGCLADGYARPATVATLPNIRLQPWALSRVQAAQ